MPTEFINRLLEEVEDPQTFLQMLITGEVLSRKGEDGPLARPYGQKQKGPQRRMPTKTDSSDQSDQEGG